jgi:hypothetical protein
MIETYNTHDEYKFEHVNGAKIVTRNSSFKKLIQEDRVYTDHPTPYSWQQYIPYPTNLQPSPPPPENPMPPNDELKDEPKSPFYLRSIYDENGMCIDSKYTEKDMIDNFDLLMKIPDSLIGTTFYITNKDKGSIRAPIDFVPILLFNISPANKNLYMFYLYDKNKQDERAVKVASKEYFQNLIDNGRVYLLKPPISNFHMNKKHLRNLMRHMPQVPHGGGRSTRTNRRKKRSMRCNKRRHSRRK